jgi:hypothetical protein
MLFLTISLCLLKTVENVAERNLLEGEGNFDLEDSRSHRLIN